MSNIEIFRKNIENTFLVSYGIVNQFIELEFNNAQFEQIKVYLDCPISTTSKKIENVVSVFQPCSPDTFELAYFICVNLQKVVNCKYDNEHIYLKFQNSIENYF